jgi:DNA-binding NarL/FixJ family response regulator
MKEPIRLIIADDHELFRQGLRSLLLRHRDLQVVAEIESSAVLRQTLATTACDVLLLDLQMDRWLLGDVAELSRLTRVLILTANETMENAVVALRSGARAIVQKRFAIRTLIEAIRAVAHGLVWMPPTLQAEIAAQWGSSSVRQLTEREAQIVSCVAVGLHNAEIAKRLTIAESTVKTHLNNVFQKLEVRDRVELAMYALRHGLVANADPGSDSNTRNDPEN